MSYKLSHDASCKVPYITKFMTYNKVISTCMSCYMSSIMPPHFDVI